MTRLPLPRAQIGALWIAMAVAGGVAVPEPAAAQAVSTPGDASPPSGADEGRYSFHRVGEGFVRLDARTGQLAQCGWAPTGWSCKAAPDERSALESEIGRLQRENADLKKSLLSRGIELPAGVMAEAPTSPPIPPASVPDPSPREPKAPTEVDLDRAVSFVKTVWRKLVDMMVDLQRDIQKKS